MLEPPGNLWLLIFPLLVAFGCYRALSGGRSAVDRWKPVFAYITVTVVWVTLTTNLIEIGENDRMRWEIEPLLAILLGCAVTAMIQKTKGRKETAHDRK
jgi:hypothetical protein